MFDRLFGRGDRPAAAPVPADAPAATPVPAAPDAAPNATADTTSDVAHDAALGATRRSWLGRLAAVFGPVDIDAETWEDLELQLVAADVGAATAADLVAALKGRASQAGVRRADELPRLLRGVLVRALTEPPAADRDAAPAATPRVVLVVGVNGSGKTTTVAKLAHRLAAAGQTVVLVAADTFRAAAIDQLALWAERAGVAIVKGTPGGDPGAVVHDALQSQLGRRADVVLIDTAGRLHTQHNLMQELAKVVAVVGRAVPGAPHETLLVLDATTGQNGLAQARQFMTAAPVDGVVLAKLDGSAKGGIALAIRRELGLPIAFIGTGEGIDDLALFDAGAYADGLLGVGKQAR